MTSALIVNAYSIGNRGDAAIVQGLIAALRSAGATHVSVAPRGWLAERDAWLQLGADAVVPPLFSIHDAPSWVSRRRWLVLGYIVLRMILAVSPLRTRAVERAARPYRAAHVIVSAGGAYLGGPKPGINLVKLANIAYGRFARRRTIVAPITVSPAAGAVGRLLKLGLRGTTVFVRDLPSMDRLSAIGVPSQLAPDLALMAPSIRETAQRLMAAPSRSASGRCICWSPRSYRPEQPAWPHRISLEVRSAEAIAALLQDDGDLHVVFIPQVTASDADDDRIAIESIITRLPERARDRIRVAEPAVSVEEAVAQFASCDALVASRLHASLLALATGVPSLVIAYEAKVAGVLAELGLEDRALPVEETWQAVDLVSRLRSLWDPEERARSITALARARTGFGAFQDTLERALRK